MTSSKVVELNGTYLEAGDVLVARMPDPLGRACLFPGGVRPCITVVDVAIIRPGSGSVDSNWLMHFINAPQMRRQIEALQAGTTRKRISRKNLGEVSIAAPPLAEQRRIVEAIEAAFSKLDAGVAYLEAATKRVAVLRRHTIDSASMGQLLAEHPGPGNDVRREWAQYHSAKPDPYVGETLPHLAPGWTWVRAASACQSIESGGTPAADLMTQDKGDVPFIKVYNLTTTGLLDFSVKPTFIGINTHHRQIRSLARPGDVLTNIVGPPLGKVSVVPSTFPEWNMNQAVVVFRPREGLDGKFLALLLQSPFVMRRLERTSRATAGQFNVSLTACRYLPLPIPSLEIQQSITREVEQRLSEIDVGARAIKGGLARAATLRRSILVAAFSGRLVPQDPTDEPASVLLERIAASRATNGTTPRPGRRRAATTGAAS